MSNISNNKTIAIAFASPKGGVSKTTTSNNLIAYLALQHYKVLAVDLDRQMNLTSCFGLSKKQLHDSSVYRIFKHDSQNPSAPYADDLRPAHVNKYVDILSGSDNLSKTNQLMQAHKRLQLAPFSLYRYIKALDTHYDFIVCDCHPSFSINTQNALIIADDIIAPVIASKFGLHSVPDLINSMNYIKNNVLINPMTTKTVVHAKLHLIGSMLHFNTKMSHEFLDIIKGDSRYIACFHYRELFNRANTEGTNIFDMALDEAKHGNHNDENTINKEIIPEYNRILDVILKDNK